MQEGVVEEPELNQQELNKLKEKLKTIENKVEIDMEKDKAVTEDLEKLIQQFLTVSLPIIIL